MSQPPPSSPYGQQPPPHNPYGQPVSPNPYGQTPRQGAGQPPMGPPGQPPSGPWQPPRRGRSNTFKFWMGVLLCIPVLFVVGALQAIPQAIAEALTLPSEVGQFATLGLDLAIFAGMIAGLVVEKTRFLVLGALAGIAVLFVIAAGACILLLVGLSNGNY